MAKKILLCEDSSFFANAISTILKDQGFDMTVAADGAIGIEILKVQKDFSLILSNIKMPNIDGFSVANFVRQDPQLMDIPFIFLTDISDQDSMIKSEELRVTDYFVKSNVGKEKITELVKKYIGDPRKQYRFGEEEHN